MHAQLFYFNCIFNLIARCFISPISLSFCFFSVFVYLPLCSFSLLSLFPLSFHFLAISPLFLFPHFSFPFFLHFPNCQIKVGPLGTLKFPADQNRPRDRQISRPIKFCKSRHMSMHIHFFDCLSITSLFSLHISEF